MTTPESRELLPCPFCGDVGHEWKLRKAYKTKGESPHYYAIGCRNDECDIKPWSAYTDKKLARKIWNTRHNGENDVAR